MSSIAFTNIATLVTNDQTVGNGLLGVRNEVTLVIDKGVISSISSQVPSGVDAVVDCTGKSALPGFVDSHTHMIFAGDRAPEFASRSRGEKYSAGGIRTTVDATRSATSAELSSNAQRLLDEALSQGTTTVEIKSGYGLNLAEEARSIDIASQFTDETTLLAAHVVPDEFGNDPDSYVRLVIDQIIPQSRAKWIDVFCDAGAFTGEQSEAILRAGIKHGMLPRIHANQLQAGRGAEIAVALDAASADHLGASTNADIEKLASSNTVATLLPGAEFSTQHTSQLGRRFLDAGAKVAIATDCNPGSSYTTSMPFCIATAVSLLGFSVEEAVHAATQGGANALRRSDIGNLSIGSRANLIILDAPSYIHLAYRPGVNIVSQTYISGRSVTTWHK